MKYIKEFDVYRKIQFENDSIDSISVTNFDEKFEIKVKLNSLDFESTVVHNNINKKLYNKNHALIFTKALGLPTTELLKINNYKSLNYSKITKENENKNDNNFFLSSKYVDFIEKEELNLIIKKLQHSGVKVLDSNAQINVTNGTIKITNGILNESLVIINYNTDNPFKPNFENLSIYNKKNEKIFFSDLDRIPLEKSMIEFLKDLKKYGWKERQRPKTR